MELPKSKSALRQILLKHQSAFLPVLPFDFTNQSILVRLDFSESNQELFDLDLSSSSVLGRYIASILPGYGENSNQSLKLGHGGYGEDRIWYRRSRHFSSGDQVRSIHLGVDLWCCPGTAVMAPLEGIVHSFKDNNNFGDYGPTIILEHTLESIKFYSLYGHLSRASLVGLSQGQLIRAGQRFAEIGTEEVNGDWPPHLHLQLIGEIGEFAGDFPGVATREEAPYYLELCPDPNLVLKIEEQDKSFI